MSSESIQQAERRRHERVSPSGPISVRRAVPVLPVSDAVVLNVSAGGVAITTRVPLKPGDRLSFSPGGPANTRPPILAEVLAVEPMDDGLLRVRCRCLLGGFDAA